MNFGLKIAAALAVFVGTVFAVLNFERPPMDSVQIGYRGVAMEQTTNPRLEAVKVAANQVPAATPAASAEGPKASEVYQNVQVLGNLSVAQFTRLMVAITSWVSPEQGCTYCHKEGAAMSDDALYTKVVARRMLQMTQNINSNWQNHVAQTGVTCYTCHRGLNVPANVWFLNPQPRGGMTYAGWRSGQNAPSTVAGLASLPGDPFTPYLSQAAEIQVQGKTALPEGHVESIQATEHTYSLMMHLSGSLGVNCTYCHNSRSFRVWDQSTPKRSIAWYGIRMVRDVNNAYLDPLQPQYPPNRLGPLGDAAKANCATCHQGVNKPLLGVSMLQDYPSLKGPGPGAAPAAAPPTSGAPSATGAASGGIASVVFFAVGTADLPNGAIEDLQAVMIELQKNPAAKATISGYHSAAGDLARNQTLAKNRAMAVRDAMRSAGIAEDRLILDKPVSAEANASGEERQARRVEVLVVE
jgi:photosynthetic reaction center cytochrome c subunit